MELSHFWVLIQKEPKAESQRGNSMPMFTAALFAITRIWKQPECPLTEESIKNTWYMHAVEYYAAFKKKANLQYATTWINPEDIMLHKNKPVTERQNTA